MPNSIFGQKLARPIVTTGTKGAIVRLFIMIQSMTALATLAGLSLFLIVALMWIRCREALPRPAYKRIRF